MIRDMFGSGPETRGVGWLPLFHDMGLIGSLLFATYHGLPLVLMTPSAFLTRPEAWLWAITRFGVSCCAAPNSAYQLCASRIAADRLPGLDLSRWRAALSGSELVNPATIEAFCARFGPHGFRPEALYPVYGLAENTLATAFPRHGRPARVHWVDRRALEHEGAARSIACNDGRARGVVSVGTALSGQSLRIVSEPGRQPVRRDCVVGEIEVRGPCVMRGYHCASEEREATGPVADGWLKTGDLGYLHDGELYVVGRADEVINRGGRKYDAADIQAAVAPLADVRAGAVAAFGVFDDASGTERLVVMAETQHTSAAARATLELAIAQRVQQALAIAPDAVLLAAAGAIPRTTSGKVQHRRARALYLAWLCNHSTKEPQP
jgi:acyl-CoA synthetase (AMP-forming)/AMP-acid ligase II